MNILVTGATGFIGSHLLALSKEILLKGDKLILLTSREIAGFLCIIHKNYTFTVQDFLEKGIMQIDKVIHIGHYLAECHEEKEVNRGNLSSINNTVYLIEHLPNIPDTFVYCSSMAVYGNNRSDPVDENSTLELQEPYAISKAMIEMILKEWSEKYGVNLHILRLSHIYGPNDKRKYTIPIWLQAAKKQQAIQLYTNPDKKRNCLYVEDCCYFLIQAAYLKQEVKCINVSSSYNVTMREIAELCKKVSKNPYDIQVQDIKDFGTGLEFKNSNLRETYLGREKVTLEEGLKKEYAYYVSLNNK